MQEATGQFEQLDTDEIPPGRKKIRYGHLPGSTGFKSESGLEYSAGVVSAIKLEGKTYEVKTSDITYSPEEFFEQKDGSFRNPHARKLYETLKRDYQLRITTSARRAELAELHMQLADDDEITGEILADEENEKDLMVNNGHEEEFAALAEEYVEKHFKDWYARKIPVTLHSFSIPKLQINFRRLIVGNIENEKSVDFWRIDEEAARTLHLAKEKLKLRTEDLTVYEVADFGNAEVLSARAEAKDEYQVSPISDERNGNVGCFNGNILIFNRATQLDRTGNGVQLEINSPETAIFIKHEIAHVLDKYTNASLGMREGFARAMEYHYRPEINRTIYRYYHSRGSMTMGRLVHVLEESPGEGESLVDFYNVSGAFLAFLYDKMHDSKKFMEFYGLLTGNMDVKRRAGLLPARAVEIHDPAEKMMTIYYRGIINSLEYCLQGSGITPDQFIREFLQFMNA